MKVVLFLLTGLGLGLALFVSDKSDMSIESQGSHEDQTIEFDHSPFTKVLVQYVDEDGFVDYAGLKDSPADLDAYLTDLDNFDPSSLGEQDQLAFWINVYNAYTLKLIINNYPIKGIRQAANGPFIPKFNTPWDVDLVKVGGKVYDLDHIEHKIIRKEFDDARVHFALVCAAISCPRLRTEAYEGTMLNEQLHEQGLDFLNSPDKNRVEKDGTQIRISKIFKWFKGDFQRDGQTLQQFLAPYFEGSISKSLLENSMKVKHTSYNWSLNDQQKKGQS